MEKYKIIKLSASVLFTVLLGGLSGIVTAAQIRTWYIFLQKPSFNPPNYLFGPVWTFLYILMGISLYLIWIQPASPKKAKAVLYFFIQFTFNICWSILFFKFHQIGWAVVEIIVMWIFILLTIVSAHKIQKKAAWLLIPYILWVSFAGVLNFGIWKLN